MSIPPQIIRVKRKRVDESPVTFLQFDDEGVKRHRSGSHWAYQRKDASAPKAESIQARDVRPIIQVSTPKKPKTPSAKDDAIQSSGHPPTIEKPRPSVSLPTQDGASKPAEPRRFHISRKNLGSSGRASPAGVKKKGKSGPALFVERSRAKRARQFQQRQASSQLPPAPQDAIPTDKAATDLALEDAQEPKPLKKPGTTTRGQTTKQAPSSTAPLPPSLMNHHNQDMDKIATDMNQWVMNEIGANLKNIEEEREKERQQAERLKLRPKAPTRRYQERHPESAVADSLDPNAKDQVEDSEEDDDDSDWVIDEYIRIPAKSMAPGVTPADVGVLILDEEAENVLFFGPENDEDEDMDEDEEDENAENYYTADYPEDEVESDDEYGRQAYAYRNGNASDDEEYDNDMYSDNDSDEMIIEGDDEDATMARIRAYNMKQKAAFR